MLPTLERCPRRAGVLFKDLEIRSLYAFLRGAEDDIEPVNELVLSPLINGDIGEITGDAEGWVTMLIWLG